MRWYSLNGVPRGLKNGSGASIRIRAGGFAFCVRDIHPSAFPLFRDSITGVRSLKQQYWG